MSSSSRLPAQAASPSEVQEHVLVLKYGADLLERFTDLVNKKQLFDAILIDASDIGFFFPIDIFLESARMARNILTLQGMLVFLKEDKAFAISRESTIGNLSLQLFGNYTELLNYSPSLANHVQVALGKSAALFEDGSDLSQQVLMSTVPVLTQAGIKLKASMDKVSPLHFVLSAIDNFTPLVSINHRLTATGRITHEELLEQLKDLEGMNAIYPIFPKIPFLVNCFKNQAPFTLKEYLRASKLVKETDLDDMMAEWQQMPVSERPALGTLSLKKGYVNARQLEIMLQDYAFYGQDGEREHRKVVKTSGEEAQVQTLFGHLGKTDPANLLQNLAQNRESGVLSVEYKDLQFKAQFETGRLTHAKVSKITGNEAIIDFASSWGEGIFVFILRTPPADLVTDACKLTKQLDKLLLDAALAKDNMDIVLKKLPKGLASVLEKANDEQGLLEYGELRDLADNKPISAKELLTLKRVWNELDGLSTLAHAIKRLADVPVSEGLKAVDRLLHYQLVTLPDSDLTGPLSKFHKLISWVNEQIGAERGMAFLRLSLRDIMGYSARARIFLVAPNGEVGVDMAATRSAGASLSLVINDIEDWQVKYVEYVSQEIKPDKLLTFLTEIQEERAPASTN